MGEPLMSLPEPTSPKAPRISPLRPAQLTPPSPLSRPRTTGSPRSPMRLFTPPRPGTSPLATKGVSFGHTPRFGSPNQRGVGGGGTIFGNPGDMPYAYAKVLLLLRMYASSFGKSPRFSSAQTYYGPKMAPSGRMVDVDFSSPVSFIKPNGGVKWGKSPRACLTPPKSRDEGSGIHSYRSPYSQSAFGRVLPSGLKGAMSTRDKPFHEAAIPQSPRSPTSPLASSRSLSRSNGTARASPPHMMLTSPGSRANRKARFLGDGDPHTPTSPLSNRVKHASPR
jgi:hypothetical protein